MQTEAIGRSAIMLLIGMSIIGLIDNFVVEIAKNAGLWQFHLFRALIALPILVVFGVIFGQRLLPIRVWAVGLRSFFLATAMLLYFASIPSMPIALVVAGLFTSPVFVLVFSWVGLGLAIGFYRLVAVGVGFLGVLLILDPWNADFSWRLLLPVAGGALYALNAIASRRLCSEESTIAMLIGLFITFGVFGAIGLFVLGDASSTEFALSGWREPTPTLLFWIVIQAVGSIVSIGLLTRAYQTAETTYLVVYEYSLLIFASFWGYVLYAQSVGLSAIFGMCLIVLSGIIIAWRERGTEKAESV